MSADEGFCRIVHRFHIECTGNKCFCSSVDRGRNFRVSYAVAVTLALAVEAGVEFFGNFLGGKDHQIVIEYSV